MTDKRRYRRVSPLRPVPAMVPFLNPPPALGRRGGNRASTPIPPFPKADHEASAWKADLEYMLQCSPSDPRRRRPLKGAALASAWPSGLRDHSDDKVAAAIRGSIWDR